MLIILEGADKVGKSTLARDLEPDKILHATQPTGDWFQEYAEPLEFYRPGAGLDVVCDRWHLGELVYGPLYRDQSLVGDEQLAYLSLFLASRGATIVLADCDEEVHAEVLRREPDGFLMPEDAEHVLQKFRTVALKNGAIIVNPLAGRQGHAAARKKRLEFVRGIAAMEESDAAPLAHFPLYVGSPHPAILLVGDRPGTLY
ncbi:MAG: hypothetical protein GEU78_16285, partial [Actinobacteria bacterium]|nr:hypothetical protein [Actinomycetota bacterium]